MIVASKQVWDTWRRHTNAVNMLSTSSRVIVSKLEPFPSSSLYTPLHLRVTNLLAVAEDFSSHHGSEIYHGGDEEVDCAIDGLY
jgi:hypothetical protein